MQALFTSEYQWLWTLGLGLSLFWPMRQLIWVLSIRRFETKNGQADDATRLALKRKAGITAGLLSFLFSVIYVNNLFQGS
ncbi:MAG: hypothetical protein HOL37_05230 [Rhodospirillaceae bacterium]|jgi:hypothetical protein|nr:hypothetical protein [Rhodospirillaceae bacterium]MBT4464358.1 hypothetical protein [Rhodospirillaceae bacterium]MBT5014029.1 hypothetical protein [Rhodospirillaceae bacterium]MBT5308720.1 hypothetical protein [Rhodospirillaceae bacterium]MBT7356946.1 hypothetical protein [Rhodospirillaceae bacterium]